MTAEKHRVEPKQAGQEALADIDKTDLFDLKLIEFFRQHPALQMEQFRCPAGAEPMCLQQAHCERHHPSADQRQRSPCCNRGQVKGDQPDC